MKAISGAWLAGLVVAMGILLATSQAQDVWYEALEPSFFVEEPPPAEEETPAVFPPAPAVESPSAVVTESEAVRGEAEQTPSPESLRDPFWPVGFVPPPTMAAATGKTITAGTSIVSPMPQWEEALKTLVVQGIMKVGESNYTAVVNGNIVSKNDRVSILFSGRTYEWVVSEISDDGVSFRRVESEP